MLGLGGCGKEPGAAPRRSTPQVIVHVAEPGDIETKRVWIGRIEPLRTYAIQAPREGRVECVKARPGDALSAGQEVILLDFPELEARRRVLIERLRSAEEEDLRQKRLVGDGAAAPADATAARLEMLAVVESLRETEAWLASGRLKSPVSGTLVELHVAHDSRVAEGQPLARMEDATTTGIRLTVATAELGYFNEVASLTVRDASGQGHAVERAVPTGPALPGFVHMEIWPSEGAPLARAAGKVEFQRGRRALLVPWTAVAGEKGHHWVGVVDPESGRVVRRTLQTGTAQGDMIEVVSGLAPGEMVLRYEPRAIAENAVVRAEIENR